MAQAKSHKKHIACLETLWDTNIENRLNVVPILELASKVNKVDFTYLSCHTKEELRFNLRMLKRKSGYGILYVAFHGGPGGASDVRTYTAEDVYAALNSVWPNDWAGFFRERVYDVAPRAPMGGLENAGWKLGFTDGAPALVLAEEDETETYDFWQSLGIMVQGDGTSGPGVITDVVPGMPAAQAGVGAGMKLLAVEGRRYTSRRLRDALRLARGGTEPIELLVDLDA